MSSAWQQRGRCVAGGVGGDATFIHTGTCWQLRAQGHVWTASTVCSVAVGHAITVLVSRKSAGLC